MGKEGQKLCAGLGLLLQPSSYHFAASLINALLLGNTKIGTLCPLPEALNSLISRGKSRVRSRPSASGSLGPECCADPRDDGKLRCSPSAKFQKAATGWLGFLPSSPQPPVPSHA